MKTTILKIISIFVIITFTTTNIGWGMPTIRLYKEEYGVSINTNNAMPSATCPIPDLSDISIPPSLGRIDETFIGQGDDIVVLIQDAHCHYDAQLKESEIIKILIEKYGFEAVYLEGAVGQVDTSIFTAYPHKEIKEKVFKEALKKGEINGADYYAIMRDNELTWMHGVEDEELYKQNYQAALELVALIADRNTPHNFVTPLDRGEVKKSPLIRGVADRPRGVAGNDFFQTVALLKEKINVLKSLVYSRKLKELDDLISQTEDLDTPHNFVTPLERGEVRGLTFPPNKGGARRAEGVTYVSLLSHLFSYIEKYDLNVDDYPEIGKLRTLIETPTAASGTSLYREDSREVPPNKGGDKKVGGVMNCINPQDFISDIHAFTTHLKSMLFCNDRERRIDFYSRMLTLVEKGAGMELTRTEWDELSKTKDRRPKTKDQRLFLNKEDKSLWSVVCSLWSQLDISPIARFYNLVAARDEAIIEHFVAYRTNNNHKKTILITGGFHTQYLKKELKKKNVSYFSVILQFTIPLNSRELYLNNLTAYTPFSSTMALCDYFDSKKDYLSKDKFGFVKEKIDILITHYQNINNDDIENIFERLEKKLNELLEQSPERRKEIQIVIDTIREIYEIQINNKIREKNEVPLQEFIMDLPVNTDMEEVDRKHIGGVIKSLKALREGDNKYLVEQTGSDFKSEESRLYVAEIKRFREIIKQLNDDEKHGGENDLILELMPAVHDVGKIIDIPHHYENGELIVDEKIFTPVEKAGYILSDRVKDILRFVIRFHGVVG